jgi:LysM repeat protein
MPPDEPDASTTTPSPDAHSMDVQRLEDQPPDDPMADWEERHVEADEVAWVDAISDAPVLDPAHRALDPRICPFLRSVDDGALAAPYTGPSGANTCAAMGQVRGQSLRQQELVCLEPAHAGCPRYLRGTLGAEERVPVERAPALPRATFAAILILILSAGISFGFVLQRGTLAMPERPEPTPTAAPSLATGEPTLAPITPTLPPTPVATPSPESTPQVTPTPEPTPEITPTPAPTPKATPKATPKPTPTSDRYKLLKPCPDAPNCWIYTVRSGDNLYSIARYFGHTEATLIKWNPWLATTPLRAGQEIRMPPPTR